MQLAAEHHIRPDRRISLNNPNGKSSTRLIQHHETISNTDKSAIANRLTFLEPCRNLVHSIVIVGSTAYDTKTAGSDTDIVIISTPSGLERVCGALIEAKINACEYATEQEEYTEHIVLSTSQIEELFQTGSPFGYSIRHGKIIRDDGYLLGLFERMNPGLPGRTYYLTSLFENIAVPFYESFAKFEGEIKKRSCSSSCCNNNHDCGGLYQAQTLAKVIMRMLYVTLPARGLMPLTKSDVATYAEQFYGADECSAVKSVISIMRNKIPSLYFDEFRTLKKFAIQLFREILSNVGIDREVLGIIADAGKISRRDYHLVNNSALKACVS